MSFIRNRNRPPAPSPVLKQPDCGLGDAFLQDTLAIVNYEIAPSEEGFLNNVPINDRPIITNLMIQYATYQKKLHAHNSHATNKKDDDVAYFLDRQRR